MIQRLQSLYLSFVFLLSLVLVRGTIFSFTDESGITVELMASGNLTGQNEQSIGQIANMWPVTVILLLIALLSLITIFLFRNRRIQLIMSIGVTVLSAILIVALSWYGSNVISTYKMAITPGLKMAIPVIIMVFSILAWRGILKDDRLVKSYDRLR